MTEFMTKHTKLTNYVCIPKLLLYREEIPIPQLLLYALLLDRARLSQANPGWVDEQGHVFCIYPLETMARDLGKSLSSVKRYILELEELGLVYRKRQGMGRSNKLYVKLPLDTSDMPIRCAAAWQSQADQAVKKPVEAPAMSVEEAAERAAFQRAILQKRQEMGLAY